MIYLMMTSQSLEKTRCNSNEPFVVVLGKWILFNKIHPFGGNFELFAFPDFVMLKQQHYTLTKDEKWKSIIGPTPLRVILPMQKK